MDSRPRPGDELRPHLPRCAGRPGEWPTVGVPVPDPRGESEYYLFLPTGARATFVNDRLHSVYFSAPRTPTKQISITVSADTFAALREQAKRANRSVAALYAEWVTEKANSLQEGEPPL